MAAATMSSPNVVRRKVLVNGISFRVQRFIQKTQRWRLVDDATRNVLKLTPFELAEQARYPISIVTWNILREHDPEDFVTRQEKLYEVLDQFDADIITLQEVYGLEFDSEIKPYCDSRGYEYVLQTSTGPTQRNWVAILLRRGRFNVVTTNHRSCGVLIGVEDLYNPQCPMFYICSCHLNGGATGNEFGTKCAYTRFCQLRAFLTKGLRKSRYTSQDIPPILITGDFNSQGEEAIAHRMLHEGQLPLYHEEYGIKFTEKTKYNTQWKFREVFDEIKPRPITFAVKEEDNCDPYKMEMEQVRQSWRCHLYSPGNHQDHVPWPAYEKYLRTIGKFGYTRSWDKVYTVRNWFSELFLLNLIFKFTYGSWEPWPDRHSYDYIYYSPVHFEKVCHQLCDQHEEAVEICYPNNVENMPSDHLPVCLTFVLK